jgi:SpoIID/LytB domain protein
MLAPYTISQPIERVRLLHDYQPTADVSIDVITGPVTLTNVHEPVPSGGSFRLRLTPSGYEIIVFGPQGSHIGTEALASPRTLTGSKDTRLRVSFKRAPEVPGVPGASYNVYRGSITLLPGFGGIDVINDVPLDQYLYGTVPAESPYTWPSEALKAQAIAARTYALSTQQSGLQAWDIDDGTIAQMYLGALIEQATTNAAVDSTKGLALLYEGAPIRAYYHACDAGHTEDASLVFPGVSAPYLKGISDIDPSGVPYDHACPKEQWSTLPMNRATVDRILGRDVFERVGSIRWIDVTARSASGRVTQIALGGTAGSYTLTGAEFRSLVNRGLAAGNQLLSTNFDVRPAS